MYGRFIDTNDGNETPSSLLFVDTESYSTVNPTNNRKRHLSLRLWCAVHVRLENGKPTRRKYATGDNADSFWQFVWEHSSPHRCMWVFAHNLCFDMTQLCMWELMDKAELVTTPMYKRNPDGTDSTDPSWVGKLCLELMPVFMQVRRGLCTYKFVDTCNYWPKSLNDVGACIGVAKGTMPQVDASAKEWEDYCRRDVEIIEQAMIGLLQRWREEKCGVFQVTAPMLAMTNWRHTCDVRVPGKRKLDIVCMPGHYSHAMEREAYYGGRVQCFRVGAYKQPFYQIDCNSLYPAMMAEGSFPRRLVRAVDNATVKELDAALHVYGVCARVRINSRIDTFPLRASGNVLYACGVFDTTLCGAELRRAVDSGVIERVYGAQLYSLAPIFREWVGYWYPRKVSAKLLGKDGLADYEFAKLILNSLSGKPAQSGKMWVTMPHVLPLQRWGPYFENDIATGKLMQWRGIGGTAQVRVTDSEPAFSFPLISAYITAAAREYMREIIDAMGIEHVWYMATDSLIVDETGYHILYAAGMIDEFTLGTFKLERQADEIDIVSANHYRFGDVEVCAGMSGRAMKARRLGKPLETWEQITSIIRDGPRSDVVITHDIVPFVTPDYRGTIDSEGRWHPLRLSPDPEFSDREPLPQDVQRQFLDREGVHRNLL